MPDVFEVLRDVHGDLRLLLAALENSPGRAAGASQTVLRARKAAAGRLVIDAARHEAAEDAHFWPAVRERVGDKLADDALARELETREALARLDKVEADDDEFDALLAEIIPAARQRIEFEETRVWPPMRQALSPFQARELGDQLREAAERAEGAERAGGQPKPGAPARTNAPARTKGRKAADSAVAAAGKLNSAATRRHRTPGSSPIAR